MIGATVSLDIATLGRFEVRRNHALLTGGSWSRRKVCDLFKLVLSAEQHRLHREQIQEILWSASSGENAANSFGKTLYLLRRALEPDLAAGKGGASTYLILDHDTLILTPGSMRIDADIFELAARELQSRVHDATYLDQPPVDEFDRVLALYGGEYLPDDLYEDWSRRRRDRLYRLYCWLLENAAELALSNAKGARACSYLQTLLEYNPADEQTHRRLMQVYARMGRRSEALNQYQLLRQALHEELEAQPLSETQELLRKIQAGQIAIDLVEQLHIRSLLSPEPPPPPATPVTAEFAVPDQKNIPVIEEPPPDPDRPNLNRILKAELVGREPEIERLRQAFRQATLGQRRTAFICGEPGIGKTRLAGDFTRWAQETHGATVLWGYCYAMGGSLPYQPIADAISAHVRTCTPEHLQRLLGERAVDLAKIAPDVRARLPALPQPEPLGQELENHNLFSAVAHYFAALAQERPLIVILDDLQWADAATMQLLSFLTLHGTGVAVANEFGQGPRSEPLYLMLYRADEVYETHPLRGLIAALARTGSGDELRLQRLTGEQVQRLLENIARQEIDPAFTAELYRHTEGNPFFIGEAIRALIQEGKIKKLGQRWQSMVEPQALGIPQSVYLLIERRLVRLSPDCRATLATAALLGRQFSSALLCQARNLPEEVIAEHLDDAIRVQILAPIAEPQSLASPGRGYPAASATSQSVDLTFTHDNIREVLYQRLNPLRRRTLHRQVGQTIELNYASHLQPYYGTLAYHYQMAEDATRAVSYLLKAIQHATSVYAFADVARYLETALDLLVGDSERPQRAALLSQLPDIYIYNGRLDKAIESGMAACTLWGDLGNVVKEAEARLNVSFCYHWMGRELDAIEHIQHALDCLKREPKELRLHARAHVQWGLAATNLGNVPLAHAHLDQADALHARLPESDPFTPVVSAWARSWCSFLAGSPEQMLAYALQGAELCRATQRLGWEPMMSYSAAWASMLLGQIDAGEALARATLEQAQRLNVVGALGWANLVRAFLAIQGARWEDADQICADALQIARQLHDVDLQSRVHWAHSLSIGRRGDWEAAVRELQQALRLVEQSGAMTMAYPYLLVQLAQALLFCGKKDEAQSHLNQGLALAHARLYRQLSVIGLRLQGCIWQAHGEFEEAQICFECAIAEFQRLNDVVELARTQEVYSLFYRERNLAGDSEQRDILHARAQAVFQKLGMAG